MSLSVFLPPLCAHFLFASDITTTQQQYLICTILNQYLSSCLILLISAGGGAPCAWRVPVISRPYVPVWPRYLQVVYSCRGTAAMARQNEPRVTLHSPRGPPCRCSDRVIGSPSGAPSVYPGTGPYIGWYFSSTHGSEFCVPERGGGCELARMCVVATTHMCAWVDGGKG
jgi:hypothetical protein